MQTLRKHGKIHKIDTSHHFYEAFAKTIYGCFDDLDQQFIEEHVDIAGKHGADMIVIILVGQKLFTVVLGDHYCYLTKKTEVHELAATHNFVVVVLISEKRR